MKNYILSILMISIVTNLVSQNIVLHSDIASGTSDGIYFYGFESQQSTNYLYFVAKPSFNNEIHRTDGTIGNITRLGFNDSIYEPRLVTLAGSNLYFNGRGANNTVYNYIESTNKISVLAQFTSGEIKAIKPLKNNAIVFLRTSSSSMSNPDQIWYSDGTQSGTIKIYDGDGISSISNFSKYAGSLIISDGSTNTIQKEALITDGTSIGTILLKEYLKSRLSLDIIDDAIADENVIMLYAQKDGKYSNFLVTQNEIKDLTYKGNVDKFFKVSKNFVFNTSQNLNVYDTTTKQILTFNVAAKNLELLKVNDKFYFSVDQSSKELWESDGTILGTKVIEANLGTSFFKTFNFNSFGSLLHYTKSGTEVELWEYNSTTKNQRKLTSLFKSSSVGFKPSLIYFKNKMYFAKNTSTSGNELWVYTDLISDTKQEVISEAQIARFDYTNNVIEVEEEYRNANLIFQFYDLSGKNIATISKKGISYLSLDKITTRGQIIFCQVTDDKVYQSLKIVY